MMLPVSFSICETQKRVNAGRQKEKVMDSSAFQKCYSVSAHVAGKIMCIKGGVIIFLALMAFYLCMLSFLPVFVKSTLLYF